MTNTKFEIKTKIKTRTLWGHKQNLRTKPQNKTQINTKPHHTDQEMQSKVLNLSITEFTFSSNISKTVINKL